MCAGCVLESHLLGIGRPFWTPSHPKLHLGAQGGPNGPKASQGSQRGTKVTPRRTPWEPEAPQRVPKGSPRSPQGDPNELQRHQKETNKSENYIHINKTHANSRSTAIQRPTNTIYPYDATSILLVGLCMAVDREFACILFRCI